jgi:hypothetical protein
MICRRYETRFRGRQPTSLASRIVIGPSACGPRSRLERSDFVLLNGSGHA